MGSEPDNEAWKINFAGGYNLGARTRLSGSISYGKMTQDQTFLPFSSVFPSPIPLPRDNLDGEIETLYANINVSTRVTSKLSLRGRYTYDERDNKTPRDIYVRIPGDAGAQGGLISGNARVNWPYNLKRHKLDLEASYNLMRGTRISAGYEFESKDRDFTEFESTDEHTGKLRLSFTPSSVAGGWVRYQHQERSGDSTYVSNQPFLTGHNPDYIEFLETNDPDGLFENDPLLRKFHLADRDRDQVAAAVNFYPSDVVALTLSGRYNKDDFNESEVGLQDSKNSSISLDASFTPNKMINLHGYLTYENYQYRQRAFYHPGFLGDLTPTTDRIAVFGENFWGMKSEDDVVTGGGGFDWTVIEDKFTVKADFLASFANTETTPFDVGADLQPSLPLPDLKTDLYRVTLEGEYKYRENMGVRVRYLYENFDTSDFARDLVTVDTLDNVILLGNGTPNYSDHVIGVSWFYNWQ
jgi:MtrB/PioB family decaheme-associated outer membrane protein